jgi:hypothetical protein
MQVEAARERCGTPLRDRRREAGRLIYLAHFGCMTAGLVAWETA